MNKGLYRLIFSQHLHMLVPAPESAHGNAARKSPNSARVRRRALAAVLALLAIDSTMAAPLDGLQPGGGSWTGAGALVRAGNIANINQTQARAILNWTQLNLAHGETLNFNQTSSTWSVLNNIHDNNASIIAGAINAPGNVYLINSNGIVFSNGAQINTGSLVAGSLSVSDALFNSGVLSNSTLPVFAGTGGYVQVDQGANITTSNGGHVWLLAPRVENSGVITTPQGQTILAAGQQVYLKSSTDPAGVLVEVNAGGTATNIGEIVAKQGNITLVGLAVNQRGRISATTSVNANGSIYLKAQDTVAVASDGTLSAQSGGVLTIAKDSSTTVGLETTDATTVIDQQAYGTKTDKVTIDYTKKLINSTINLSGGIVNIDGSVVAHGGQVNVTAAVNPGNPNQTIGNAVSASRINLGADALIDVSGVNASADMSENQLVIKLNSAQVANAPQLHAGSMIGQTVYIDARKGTGTLNLADAVQEAEDQKGHNISQLMVNGGSVNLSATTGDILLQSGATINLSGGTTNYQAGYVKESSLNYQGKSTAISSANNTTPYSGLSDVYTVTDAHWGVTRTWNLNPGDKGIYYQAYSVGNDAGVLNLNATNYLLQANVIAKTSPSLTQRQARADNVNFSQQVLPFGGTLNINLLGTGGFSLVASNMDALVDGFSIVGAANQIAPVTTTDPGTQQATTNLVAFASGDALPSSLQNTVHLDTSLFNQGVSNLSVTSAGNNHISVDGAINTGSNGAVTLTTGGQVDVNANITAAGGKVTISGTTTNIANNTTVSVAGSYTNDTRGIAGALTAPVVLNGGTVKITGANNNQNALTLGTDALIDASAGAWLTSSGNLTGGKGGTVSLTGIDQLATGQVQAYGFIQGGTLNLSSYDSIQIGGLNSNLNSSFFSQGGFSNYNINTLGIGNNIAVASTNVQPQVQSLLAAGNYGNAANGSPISGITTLTKLPLGSRAPASISLNSVNDLTIAQDATIQLDAPSSSGTVGTISLNAKHQLSILGSLITPAGNINATLTGIPSGDNSAVYDNTQSLFVGSNARLIATGYYLQPPALGGSLANAKVLNGGNINLSTGLRAAALVLKQGSLLDVSGVNGLADVSTVAGISRQTEYGTAGSISLTSRDALILDGDLRGNASGSGAGGSLALNLKGSLSGIGNSALLPGGTPGNPNFDPTLATPDLTNAGAYRTLTVTQNKIDQADTLNPGDALDSLFGQGQISAAQINTGGFANVNMAVHLDTQPNDAILLPAGLNLSVATSIALDAPTIQVTGNGLAQLQANYVALSNSNYTAPTATSTGTGSLKVSAQFIDLINSLSVSGVNTTQLIAQQDIRGRGDANNAGGLTVNGELDLTARQIYPATNATFTFTALGNSSLINVQSSGETPTSILSAGGTMNFAANDITQGGVVIAPLGQINLNATDTLTLTANSVTSVSAAGQIIPYGLTGLGGSTWYTPSGQLTAATTGSINTLPAKKINFTAANIQQQTGATVNLSGGGDVFAYEYVNGVGGTSDVLGLPGMYALIPTMQNQYAPYDYSYNKVIKATVTDGVTTTTNVENSLKPGTQVYLSGIAGLAAGYYTLLPGRYALLPGAYLLQTSSAQLPLGSSALQTDGSSLVTGYFSQPGGASRDANYSTFKLTSASFFQTPTGTLSKAPAEYRLSYGNSYFTNLAIANGTSVSRLPQDAGQLVLAASNSLSLGASIIATKPANGRGALLDISSSAISVVSSVGPDDGTLQLTADSLNNFGVESLLLGGTRTETGDGGFNVTTTASTVNFANDSSHTLVVPELIATASDTLTVSSGASIATLPTTHAVTTSTLQANGSGALLAVSSLQDINYSRIGVSNPTSGTLNINTGATIQAGRSLVLDSTYNASMAGAFSVGTGGSASLGANRILLGNAGNVAGLAINNALLASLGNLSRLTLNSYNNVDIYGPVSFGNNSLNLTINSAGIGGHMAANEVASLTANTLTIENINGSSFESVATGTGSSLNVNADSIVFQGNAANATTSTIGGFDTTNLNATGAVLFNASGSTQLQSSQNTINSARISTGTGANYTLTTTGNLTTSLVSNPDNLAAANGLGGKLTLQAATLNLGGQFDLPSGQLTAEATSGDLTVLAGANIKAASVPVGFKGYTEYTPGGVISLVADLANVNVMSGSTLDVSGAAKADAGTVKVSAVNGTADIQGTLLASAGATQQGGSFLLDTKVLPSFSTLNSLLNAGSFNYDRELRIRSGDITIAAADAVTAHNFILSVDGGKLDIAGTVNANGSNGGDIEVYARDNVTLKSTGKLLARGTGDTLVAGDNTIGAGGSVLLSSLSTATTSAVSAESGALIDVSGDQQGAVTGSKGKVTMRGYRGTSGNTNTVNVDFNATAAINGAGNVRIEGVKVYNSASFNATTPNIIADTNSFYNANPGAGSYASTQDGGLISVLPDIEVRSANSLTIGSTATDLNMRALGALQAGKGGTLTLRANNDIAINGSLSDGFNTAVTTGVLQTGSTFSYNLIAGSDFTAANPTATNKGVGNITLANNKLIRTGTGDINIAAGGNLIMGNNASVIYTTGVKAAALSGFTAPANALYLTNGGNININAQGNIVGAIGSTGAQQLVNQWLFRQGGGSSNLGVTWWVRPDLFQEGVAAFGGGNLSIKAGGNITNFSAAVPTTGRYANDGSGNSEIDGGGNLTVTAGNNLYSGVYYAGKGGLSLSAGGDISSSSNTFGTMIALQNASAKVSATGNAAIATVFNPTMWAQATANANSSISTTGSSSFYLTYDSDTSFDISSLTGNVGLGLTATSAVANKLATGLNSGIAVSLNNLAIAPSSVSGTAFSGNINLGSLLIAPSATGNLSLLAANSITSGGASSITISDANPNLLASISSPVIATNPLGSLITNWGNTHDGSLLHANDTQPVVIIARDGSVSLIGDPTGTNTPGLTSPKAVDIEAGKDITLYAAIQHDSTNDLSVINAGRDFIANTDNNSQVQLAGPGNLLVEAGRNVSLGTTKGINSVANANNAALPSTGGSITVLAGLGTQGADLADFIATYINPTGAGPATLQGNVTKLANYRSKTNQAVTAYMQQLTGDSSLTDSAAMTDFLALDSNRQAVFAYRQFSSELLASGVAAATTRDYTRGYNAIASLFPSNRQYQGDINMYNSQIKTSSDGSIDLLAPGGLIEVGVSTSSSSVATHDIGLLTQHGGDIRAYADTGFQVEQSKVITQYGSNITVWVSNGDIDAGRGSKTAVSIPVKTVLTDADGNTTVSQAGVATGSGIQALTYDPDGLGPLQAPAQGDVAFIAPRGIVNAGEAGINARNILVAALGVQNAQNFTSSGTSTGVPASSSGSLAGSLTGVSNVASAATKLATDDVAKQMQPANMLNTKDFFPSFVSVEVIGLGL